MYFDLYIDIAYVTPTRLLRQFATATEALRIICMLKASWNISPDNSCIWKWTCMSQCRGHRVNARVTAALRCDYRGTCSTSENETFWICMLLPNPGSLPIEVGYGGRHGTLRPLFLTGRATLVQCGVVTETPWAEPILSPPSCGPCFRPLRR